MFYVQIYKWSTHKDTKSSKNHDSKNCKQTFEIKLCRRNGSIEAATATLQKMSEERISKKTEVGLNKVDEKIANRNGNQNACSETVEKYSIEYTNCKNETEDQSVREELFRYRWKLNICFYFQWREQMEPRTRGPECPRRNKDRGGWSCQHPE